MLKKLFLLSSVLLIGVSSHAQFVLKATPFVILKNQVVNISGEFAIPSLPNCSYSIGLAYNFTVKNDLSDKYKNLRLDTARSFSGFSIEPSFRKYLLPEKKKFEGLYTGIYSSFRYSHSYYSETETTNSMSYTGGSIRQNTYTAVVGFDIGYQFRLGKQKNFIIDIYTGIGGKTAFYNRNTNLLQNVNILNTFQNGIATRGNVSIGYIMH